MKTHSTLISLATALILPSVTLGFGDGDPVAASFQRDLHREPSVQLRKEVTRAQDPLEAAFPKALDGHPDPIPASFQRAVDREPAPRGPISVAERVSDPLVIYIAAALSSPKAA